MKKKLLCLMLSGLTALSLMACGSTGGAGGTEVQTDAGESTAEDSGENEQESTARTGTELYEGEYTIGIAQFAEHGSLDNCRQGFLEGLKEEGFVEGQNLKVLFDNAQADTSTSAMITDGYVSQNVDLICAIATPTAMSAYNSAMDTDIPVIYTAVSDPVAAQLANADKTPVGNITGTSDALPVEAQLKLIREVLPEATKIGILYTTSETNSESTLATYEELAPAYGFEIVKKGVATVGDVELAAAELVSEVDCLSNLTDNTVVSALQTVLAKASEAGIPVFGSEIEQVRNGCIAAMGLDYIELGKQTGHMAAKVLKGEAEASEMNFEIITEASLYVNTEVSSGLGLQFGAKLLDEAAEVFTAVETK